MKKRLIPIFLLFLLFMHNPCTCVQQPRLLSRQTTDYFMTVSALFLYEEDKARFLETWSLVKQTLAEIENAVSVSKSTSDIARFNALSCGVEIEICPVTAGILRIAMDVHVLSGGLFDPTIFPLVDLWGFSPRFNQNTYTPVMPFDRAYENGRLPLPDEAHICALLPLVGLDGVQLREEDGAFYLKKITPDVIIDGIAVHAQIDLGGVAKGYACDRVLALLKERGHTMGHFVCGGSSMALLSRPDGDYALTLRKPRIGQSAVSHYATLRASNITLSTSSDTSHSFVRDGVIYCHIIDPRTGRPINMPDESGVQRGLACATLLGKSAAYSDALTTVLCILGPEAAMDFLQEYEPGIAVLTAYQGGSDTYDVFTNAPDSLTLDDPAYRLSS